MSPEDKSIGGVNLLDAVEALTSIVDIDWEHESSSHSIEGAVDWKNPSWLKNDNKEAVIANIKKIFKVILSHLKGSFDESPRKQGRIEGIEEIKNIMVIVGEAAKKIDRYTRLFQDRNLHSVTETTEYQQLQEFYKKRISKTIDEAMLGKWILALSARTFQAQEAFVKKEMDAKHVFVDLDSVKNDTEYELFFIKKMDGTRFFSPRLIRNIKLICDFGFNLSREKDQDPLTDLPIWLDRFGYSVANSILNAIKPIIQHDYPLIIHHKDKGFFSAIHKALLALFLAASKDRLLITGSPKGCLSYLVDFQGYLREALESRTYQHLIAFPAQECTNQEIAAKKILEALLKQIFEGKVRDEYVNSYVQYIINESKESLSQEHSKAATQGKPIWSRFACDWMAIKKFLRNHPNGPLNKVMQLIEEGNYHVYDPYMQMKLPEFLFDIPFKDFQVSVHRLPSPTKQEAIHQATLIDEWLGYLHFRKDEGHMLIVNYQDNTSWREHARAFALEGLQEATEFQSFLTIATLPKDTEFYHQEMAYQEEHQLQVFLERLLSQVLGKNTGFYLPDKVRSIITREWMEGMAAGINRLFFSGKNVLSREARLDFIEIFYAFLEIKLLETTRASSLFLTCKDGMDTSPTAACLLYLLIRLLKGEEVTGHEIDQLTDMIYRPALFDRERTLLTDRAERMLSAIKCIENGMLDFGGAAFKEEAKKAFSSYLPSLLP